MPGSRPASWAAPSAPIAAPQELAPRDPDVRANLQFARNQPGLAAPALPGVPWARWTTRLTLNEWTVLCSLFAALFFAVLTARQIWPAWKKSTAGLAWALAAASVCVDGLPGPGAGRPFRGAILGRDRARIRGAARSRRQGRRRLHRPRRRGTVGLWIAARAGWKWPTPPGTRAGSPKPKLPSRPNLE